MSQSEETLAVRFSDSQEILRLSQKAVRAALLDHKRTGDPIAVWRDGRVVLLPADQIELPDPEPQNLTASREGGTPHGWGTI